MDLLISWLLWLDAERVRFWTLAWAAFGLTAILALASPADPSTPSSLRSRLLFALSLLFTFAAFRWPTWFVPGDLNPDEAQILAGAITLQRFPVYWKFVDGTTHGPFCELPLLVASVFGAPLNYVTARIVAALLQATSLVAVWGTVRCFASERVARVAILPGLAFWCFVSFHDYVNYSSELTGLCLLALAGWGITRALTAASPGGRESWLMYGSGLALGAVPLSKLQSGPQAAALALAGLFLLWRGSNATPPARWHLARYFVAGGVSVPALTLGFLLVYRLWGQFWTAYILNNLGYSKSGVSLNETPAMFLHFAMTGYFFAWYFAGSLAFVLLYARADSRANPALRTAKILGALMVGVSFGVVVLPGREATHYLHLLVIPVTLLAGLILASAMNAAEPAAKRPGTSWVPLCWFALLTLVPQIHYRAVAWHEFLGGLRTNLAQRQSAAARYITQHAQPADTLAMWGWEPNLFVQTGLAQGTREGATAFQMDAGPLQQFYVDRYMWDLRRRRPAWFVDAVGPGAFIFVERSSRGHESMAGLGDYIARYYDFVAELENKRIYRLKPGALP